MTQTQAQSATAAKSDEDVVTKPEAKPTLFIALGGTGFEVLTRFRRRIFEKYDSADYFPYFAFLGIDTDSDNVGSTGIRDAASFKSADCINTGMDSTAVSATLNNLEQSKHHLSLFLSKKDVMKQLDNIGFTKGAGAIRPAGRMLFIEQLARIREAITVRMNSTIPQGIRRAVEKGIAVESADQVQSARGGKSPKVDVVIVASIAGGTGAGSLIDCTYLIHYLKSANHFQLGEVRAFLLLPEHFEAALKSRDKDAYAIGCANGYAALREIEHLNQSQRFQTDCWGSGYGATMQGVRPFSACYLFSKTNGAHPLREEGVRPVEAYQLVADCLEFMVGTSKLSSRLMSNWSNASILYNAESKVDSLFALEDLDGGYEKSEPNVNAERFAMFEPNATRCYSAMGVAKVSLKLPELQRLASVRWLRRLIVQEMGPRQSAEQWDVDKEGKKVLGGKWPKNISDPKPPSGADKFTGGRREKLRDAFVKALNGCESGTRANSIWEDMQARLNQHCIVIEAGDVNAASARDVREEFKVWAKERFTFTDDAAEADAKAISDDLRPGKPLRKWAASVAASASHCGSLKTFINERLKYLHEQRNSNPQLTRLGRLRSNWENADQTDGWGTAPLRHKAQDIIKANYVRCGVHQLETAFHLIEAKLDERYLTQLALKLKDQLSRIDGEIDVLAKYEQRLASLQSEVAKALTSSRDNVLYESLGASSDQPDRERALDKEIDLALSSDTMPAGRTTDMDKSAWGKKRLLELYRDEYQSGLEAKTTIHAAVAKGDGRTVLMNLVDIASVKFFKGSLPAVRDVFTALDESTKDLDLHGRLTSIANNANPYWEANANTAPDKFSRFGSVENRNSGAFITTMELMRERGIGAELTEPQKAEARQVEGDITIVNDFHGYRLLSLQKLDQYRESYNTAKQISPIELRHIDPRWINVLPDLTLSVKPGEGTDAAKRDVAKSRDVALKGIIIGQLVWAPAYGRYYYRPPNDAADIEMGETFEQVSQFLRNNTRGVELRPRIEKAYITLVDGYLAQGRQTNSEEIMRAAIEKLIQLKLVYAVLREKVFPDKKASDGEKSAFNQLYTMTRRLAFEVDQRIKGLCRTAEQRGFAISAAALEKTAERDLQHYVLFVGRGVDHADAAKGLFPDQSTHRLLRLFPEKDAHANTGQTMLDEASFKLNWFGKDYTLETPPHLFVKEDLLRTPEKQRSADANPKTL